MSGRVQLQTLQLRGTDAEHAAQAAREMGQIGESSGMRTVGQVVTAQMMHQRAAQPLPQHPAAQGHRQLGLETPVQLAGREVRGFGNVGSRHRAGQVLGNTGQRRLHAAVQRLWAAQPWQPVA